MGGLNSPGYAYFKKLFKEGFEAARKHSDSLISTLISLSTFLSSGTLLIFGEQQLSSSCRRVRSFSPKPSSLIQNQKIIKADKTVILRTDSKLDCFALFGDQTAAHFRERFQLGLTTQAVDAYLERLIVTSTGSNYTKLYDTFQYYRLVFFPFSVLHPRSLT